MSKDAFRQPVTVLVGLGFPRPISTVREAVAYLSEVPRLLHDVAYQATCDACRDAMTQRCSVQEARDVFAAYARRRNVLVEEPVVTGNVDAEFMLEAS